jgi:hypothetical protein
MEVQRGLPGIGPSLVNAVHVHMDFKFPSTTNQASGLSFSGLLDAQLNEAS